MNINNLPDDKNLQVSNWGLAQVKQLIEELTEIHADMVQLETDFADRVQEAHRSQRNSARNLLHYLALRQRDLRRLQESLTMLGLSSLGRTESHVTANIDAVMKILFHLANRPAQLPEDGEPVLDFAEGKAILEAHTEALLGQKPANRAVRIMVTMPAEAAEDYNLVRELLANGMNCMRINCARDDMEIWSRMIGHLRRAEQKLGKECLVFMDLAGPKLRTGSLEPGPQVIKWRPERDDFGRILAPARIWLTPLENREPAPVAADASLPVPGEWLANLRAGDSIRFLDTREAARSIKIVEEIEANRWAESHQTSYVATGTILHCIRNTVTAAMPAEKTQVGAISPNENFILLKKGDTLLLTGDARPGRPAVYDEQGRLLKPARISITLPEIFSDVRAGVMIARGDLAIECGYERMAEIQEEVLWICEAGHMPVIWATQVLESLAQKGKPSRAEITDAAMAERAECVMLNKGPYIVEAVRVLDDILQRMETHQSKKRSMLRKLKLAHLFHHD